MSDALGCLVFGAMLVMSYFREMQLRAERDHPRCTLFHAYRPPAVAAASGLNSMD